MTVADWLAGWLKSKGIRHAFGIIGAGNVMLFDAIARLGYTTIICNHHEQASAQAATYYWRTCGKLAVVLPTTGGGSSNTLTGVLAAHMDSIPLLVISGNEPSKYMTRDEHNRVIGVQGYHSSRVAEGMTKWSGSVRKPEAVQSFAEQAINAALTPRFGAVWLDICRDVQTMEAP